jgi:hypothetical protein
MRTKQLHDTRATALSCGAHDCAAANADNCPERYLSLDPAPEVDFKIYDYTEIYDSQAAVSYAKLVLLTSTVLPRVASCIYYKP